MLNPDNSSGCSIENVACAVGATVCIGTTIGVSAAVAPSLMSCIFPAEVYNALTGMQGFDLLLYSVLSGAVCAAATTGTCLGRGDDDDNEDQQGSRACLTLLCGTPAFLCATPTAAAVINNSFSLAGSVLSGTGFVAATVGSGVGAGCVAGALSANSVMLLGKMCRGQSDEQSRLLPEAKEAQAAQNDAVNLDAPAQRTMGK